MNSLELFVGAGGLALGISRAGFKHVGVIEKDKYCCDTIRENNSFGLKPIIDWPLIEGDVRQVNFGNDFKNVEFISGGPPCQPFSIGGKHKGNHDSRNMFPEAIRSVREIFPKAFVFENVRGLARQSFFNFFQYICLQFEFPEITRKNNEDWEYHSKRLQKIKSSDTVYTTKYNIVKQILNAADYGVPQKRERIFIVGFRSDLEIAWSFPSPTHSKDALLNSQWITGDYWDQHCVPKRLRPRKPPVSNHKNSLINGELQLDKSRWQTVRDAIHDLPYPHISDSNQIPNHKLQRGARAYQGHTGSPIDEPAKTLKAGDHGVPGGENMILFPDGKVRYFTVREAARLQTFPDQFRFHGSWTETMRQLGNAVPVTLANAVATSIMEVLT